MVESALGESDLLLIVEMCDEGIEKCGARERQHLEAGNHPAADWDRRLRERYARLREEVVAELSRRKLAIGSSTAEDICRKESR